MRGLFVAVMLAGCASHPATGPAWPGSTARDHDGGESLAPHVAHQITDVADHRDTEEPHLVVTPAVVVAVPAAASGGGAAPLAVSPSAAPTEETFTTEEIVIEIDDTSD